jgi:5-methylcytosine-specific restriction protein A
MPSKPRPYNEAAMTAKRKARDKARGNAPARGYDSDWSKAAIAWRITHPWCVDCLEEGRMVQADVVDHIKPLWAFPELRLDPSNFQSLCRSHNALKVARDARLYRARS